MMIDDLLIQIFNLVDLSDLINVLQVSSHVYSLMNDESMWRKRLLYEFGHTFGINENLKNVYQNCANLYVYGENHFDDDNSELRGWTDLKKIDSVKRCNLIFAGRGFSFYKSMNKSLQCAGYLYDRYFSSKYYPIYNHCLERFKNIRKIFGKFYNTFLIDGDDSNCVEGFGLNVFSSSSNVDKSTKHFVTLRQDDKYSSIIRAGDADSGDYFAMFLDENGQVFLNGCANFGCWGESDQTDEVNYLPLSIPVKIRLLSCGQNHGVMIDVNEEMWIVGDSSVFSNKRGADVIQIPQKFDFHQRVKKVACGNGHTLFTNFDDQLFGWGENIHGQLGLGQSIRFQSNPILLTDKIVHKFDATSDRSGFVDAKTHQVWFTGHHGYYDKIEPKFDGYTFKMFYQNFRCHDLSMSDTHTLFIGFIFE